MEEQLTEFSRQRFFYSIAQDARIDRFTRKAELERLRDGLLQTDVLEAIISATAIKKILRSTSPFRAGRREMLYVIEGFIFDGLSI